MDTIPHDKIAVSSIIDLPLWDEAHWNGVGICYYQNILALTLCFKNATKGAAIFENWKKKTGNIDEKELIDIHIFKGVNKARPTWYRVLISASQKPNRFCTR
jgi:hypothetical protein